MMSKQFAWRSLCAVAIAVLAALFSTSVHAQRMGDIASLFEELLKQLPVQDGSTLIESTEGSDKVEAAPRNSKEDDSVDGAVMLPPTAVANSVGLAIPTTPLSLLPLSDPRIAAISLGYFPTIESARAALALLRTFHKDYLETLTLEVSLEGQTAPIELRLGRLTQGSANTICGALNANGTNCDVVKYSYLPKPALLPRLTVVGAATPEIEGQIDEQGEPAEAESVIILLGNYPDGIRAEVAWALIQRLYGGLLVGVVRRPSEERDLIIGVLSPRRAGELCTFIADIVPTCLISNPATANPAAGIELGPMVSQDFGALTLPVLQVVTTDPKPSIAVAPVGEVAAAVLQPIALPKKLSVPSEAEKTVVALRLGEYVSQTGVEAGWQLIRRLYPDVLRRAQPLESADPARERRPLLVGPFNEIDALLVCARLNADGQSCRVTRARL